MAKTTKGPVGLKIWKMGSDITVTELEVHAVRMWVSMMLPAAKIAGDQGEFTVGFFTGLERSSDEDVAQIIAMGKLMATESGGEPLCAEVLETH